jgi:hypothetical protein
MTAPAKYDDGLAKYDDGGRRKPETRTNDDEQNQAVRSHERIDGHTRP